MIRHLIIALTLTVALATCQNCYLVNVEKLYSFGDEAVSDFDFATLSPVYRLTPIRDKSESQVVAATKAIDKNINEFLSDLFGSEEGVYVPKESWKRPTLRCYEVITVDGSEQERKIACNYVATVCYGSAISKRDVNGLGDSLVDKIKNKLGNGDNAPGTYASKRSTLRTNPYYEVFTTRIADRGFKFTIESTVVAVHGVVGDRKRGLLQDMYEQSDETDYVAQDNTTSPDFEQYRTLPIGVWGVDRIDQRYRPMQQKYTIVYPPQGVEVEPPIVYVIDTDIYENHPELTGRASRVYDHFPTSQPYNCNPHGTHVAGIAAGKTVGVNPGAIIKNARVLDCNGQGDTASIALGMNAIIDDCPVNRSVVINLSLGGQGSSSTVDNLFVIAKQVCQAIIVVAAGNSADDACDYYPAGSQHVISTAATDVYDNFASFSNYGSCVDISAPGVKIKSSVYSSGYASYSGTSMASPHVAGVASLYAGLYDAKVDLPQINDTSIYSSPASVNFGDYVQALIAFTSTGGVVNGSPLETKNSLLYINQVYVSSPLSPSSEMFPPNISEGGTPKKGSILSAIAAFIALKIVILL